MKKLSFTIVSVLVLVTVVSCSKETTNIPAGCDYFPMQVQNTWKFEHSVETTVTATKVIDQKTYFVFVSGTDTSYFRKENNKIYTRRANEAEALKFNLNAAENQSWQYNAWTVTMTDRNDTVVINHAKIPNCYRFFFDIPGAVDDEHIVWLAPGIGFIRKSCGFCPYPIDNLTNARINNVAISFP